jgi:magnesium transporter
MATPQETTRILRRLLASGMDTRAERVLMRMHPADLGPVLSGLTPPEIRTVIDLLFRHRRAARTLIELPPEMLPNIFEALGDERLAQVMARLERDDLVELVEWLPEDRREVVVSLLPDTKRGELRKAALYPEDSAGRVMTSRFLALGETTTAQEAIERIRAAGDDNEVFYLYVVDDKEHLRGVVPLRRLVAAAPARPVGELMIPDPVATLVDADQESVARLVARYNLLAIPVVDADGRIQGVITVDDVIEVITEEATEDIYHLAGLDAEEDRVFNPAGQSVRRRLPWMLLNLAATFLIAGVIGLFERTLEQLVALAFFMPVVAGMGGNGGIQSLTVITRAIALGEIEFSSGLRAVGREVAVAATLGAVTGAVSGVLATLWQGSPWLGLVLFNAMLLTMIVGGVLGAAVPLLLKALGQDPALGSGVLVTTLTDICGFVAFLGVGTLLLDRLI